MQAEECRKTASSSSSTSSRRVEKEPTSPSREVGLSGLVDLFWVRDPRVSVTPEVPPTMVSGATPPLYPTSNWVPNLHHVSTKLRPATQDSTMTMTLSHNLRLSLQPSVMSSQPHQDLNPRSPTLKKMIPQNHSPHIKILERMLPTGRLRSP